MIRRPGRDDAEAFHQAWESGTPAHGEVAELVGAAEALCEAAVAAPRPEFSAALRERLMTAAAPVRVPDPGAARRTPEARPAVAAPSRGRRRLAGLAAAAASSLGVVGLVAGSASALPGDVLYPVKRTVETVELSLHRSDEARGQQRLAMASERLDEVRALLADGSAAQRSQVTGLLDEFSEQAELGSAELFDAYGASGSEGTVGTVDDFTAASAVDLSTMAKDVPTEANDAFSAAAAVVTDLAGQVSRLCSSCGTADVSGLVTTVRQVLGTSTGTSRASASNEQRSSEPATPRSPASSRPSTGGGTPTPSVDTTPLLPTPTPSSDGPKGLGKVTQPIIGGLLGDDEQQGLVPGLVDGLLGSPSK
jgi:hypothetical protein